MSAIGEMLSHIYSYKVFDCAYTYQKHAAIFGVISAAYEILRRMVLTLRVLDHSCDYSCDIVTSTVREQSRICSRISLS